ncbi:MAG: phosphotriesterase-related protein [Kiritimatiellia bacterium]
MHTQVMTVTGPVLAGELGIILPHEHVFINLVNQFHEPEGAEKKALSRAKISMANYGFLRRNPYAIRENLVMDDLDLAATELEHFARLGGRTVVDCTSIGIGRAPEKLRAAAERTGLKIVAGCGYYTQDTHPQDMGKRTIAEIAGEMVRDLTEGIGETGIRAGVIGEIGTSDPIHPDEMKNLRAAAEAHRQTGAPIQVHTYPWGKTGIEAADALMQRGVDPGRIVICHIDVVFDFDYLKALLKLGVYVEFDNFGKEFYIDREDRLGFSGGIFATDLERVRAIRQLIEWGYERHILITNDLCLKQMLRSYGGWGYGHILRHIVPMMEDVGIPRRNIDLLIKDNPAAWLCGA